MNYRESIAYCAKNEAYLAEVTSEEDRLFFRDLLTHFTSNKTVLPDIWLGHLFDSQNSVWTKKSDGTVIKWKGWMMYSTGDHDFPFLSSEIGVFKDKDEQLVSTSKHFFCIKYFPASPFRNILKGNNFILS